MLTLFLGTLAQATPPLETVTIKTSIECEMCEARLEKSLYGLKGIKKIKVNIPTKEVTVTFDSKKVSAQRIRQVIAMTGYDADEVKADKTAYEKLPACCQKGGHG